MTNLGQLFQVAPITAAGFTGQQIASDQAQAGLDQQRTLADIMKAQQDMDFNTQANPLRLKGLGLDNDRKVVDIEGQGIINRKNRVDTNEAEATSAGKINATNKANDLSALQSQIKKYQTIADVFTNAATEVQHLPPIMRGVRIREILENNGMKADDAKTARFLQEVTQNPQGLIQRAEAAKRRAAELTPEFIKQSMMEREHNKRNAADNVSREKVATTQANGRIAAVKAKAEGYKLKVQDMVRMGKLKANEIPAAYRAEAATETDPDVRAWLLQEAALAHQANLDRGNARAQPGLDENGNIIQNKPNNVYDKEAGGTPDIAAQAKAAWGGYDPQKYDYRVGPNGKLQRKEK